MNKELKNKKNLSNYTHTKQNNQQSAFIRAANEDDDGYDPYSDRKEYRPLFERDPWK